jgi:glycosyltransferase involved in cell wall biosynthesis
VLETSSDILHIVEHCRGGEAIYVRETIERQKQQVRWRNVKLLADPSIMDDELSAAADKQEQYVSSRRPDLALKAAKHVQQRIAETAPAAVHLHSNFPGVYGRLFQNLGPTKPAIVYYPHGWAFEMETPTAKKAVYQALERWLTPRADVIISISEHERSAATAAGIVHPAHIAIPHGMPPPLAGARPDAMAADVLNLLFVGLFDRQKGLDLLALAFRQVTRQDIALHVIGEPSRGDGAAPNLSDPRIHVHGWVDHSKLDAWYAAADAVVMPSRWEGFGLVPIEAMRNGTAVLASKRGALPEVLGAAEANQLFDPDDTKTLTALLQGLDRATLKTFGLEGLAHFQACYTAVRAATDLDSAYDLAIARRQVRL